MTRRDDLRAAFRRLHLEPPDHPTPGILVVANPWDIGSARLLVSSGAVALATTSAGLAATLGRTDQHVTRAEAVGHGATLATAVDVPVSVDAEDGFGDALEDVAATAAALADTDVAGFSIEDYDPRAGRVRSVEESAERVAVAKAAGGDLVLTARADGLLYGTTDLDDTIRRLERFRDAGADVVYAPGLLTNPDIGRVVDAVGIALNVLALPGTPPVPELAALGVARVSVGSLFANAAYGALIAAAHEVFGPGTQHYATAVMSSAIAQQAFGS